MVFDFFCKIKEISASLKARSSVASRQTLTSFRIVCGLQGPNSHAVRVK